MDLPLLRQEALGKELLGRGWEVKVRSWGFSTLNLQALLDIQVEILNRGLNT